MNSLVGENANKIQDLQEEEMKLLSKLRNLTDENIRMREEELSRKEAERQEEEQRAQEQKKQMTSLEELFKQSDEFVHKENVKVYRNVQAVVVDEFKKQAESILEENQRLHTKLNVVMIVGICATLFSVAGIVIQILSGLGILPF